MRVSFKNSAINALCFVVGMIGVWHYSHNWEAMLSAFVASLDFTFKAE